MSLSKRGVEALRSNLNLHVYQRNLSLRLRHINI